jgi:RAB protein geranylgeranyltransferase component A
MSNKKQLQDELNAILEQEIELMRNKHYPIFQKKYEGKFFKTINSYGGNTPSWWVYTKITKIKKEDIYYSANEKVLCSYLGWNFQTCSMSNVTVERINHGYIHSLGKEISEKEFNEAWNKTMDSLNNLP